MKHIWSILMLMPTFANAKPVFQHLLWKADKSVEITFQTDAGEKVAKGFLDDNGSTSSVIGSLAVSAHSLTSSFVVLEYADIGIAEKYLLVLERQNAEYRPVAAEVTGPAETVYADFQTSIALLMKSKKWNSAQAVRAFADYVNAGGDRKIADFRATVEAEQVELAKPISRRENVRKKALPAEVAKVKDPAPAVAVKAETPKSKPSLRYAPAQREEPVEAVTVKPKRKTTRREPLPYEPRYDNPGARNYSNYPGQRLRRRPSQFNEWLYR